MFSFSASFIKGIELFSIEAFVVVSVWMGHSVSKISKWWLHIPRAAHDSYDFTKNQISKTDICIT